MLRDEGPLVLGQRTGLVEDRVGNGHLADVVKLGRAHEDLDVLPLEAEAAADRSGQRRDLAEVLAQRGPTLAQSLEEDVGALANGAVAATVLVTVPALIGEPKRSRRVPRLDGKDDRPVRARHREPLTVVGERLGDAGDHRRDRLSVTVEERAELVAAHPVGATVRADRLGHPLGQSSEERVACRVPVRVVVALEPIRDRRAPARGASRRWRPRARLRGQRSTDSDCPGR